MFKQKQFFLLMQTESGETDQTEDEEEPTLHAAGRPSFAVCTSYSVQSLTAVHSMADSGSLFCITLSWLCWFPIHERRRLPKAQLMASSQPH